MVPPNRPACSDIFSYQWYPSLELKGEGILETSQSSVSGAPSPDTKPQGCSSPLYKMAQDRWSTLAVGLASGDTEGRLNYQIYILENY